jgi:hypothetical protein
MEWVTLGSLTVSKDGFVILMTEHDYNATDGSTTVHMPCIGGHIAHVGTYTSLEQAKQGTEYMLAEPIDS